MTAQPMFARHLRPQDGHLGHSHNDGARRTCDLRGFIPLRKQYMCYTDETRSGYGGSHIAGLGRQGGSVVELSARTSRTAVLRGGARLIGFGLSVALLAISSLLLIPAMVEVGGQRAWGAIAVGQTIGAVAAVLIYFGWGHTGPAMVARADIASARQEFSESVRTRLVLFGPVALVACGLAALVSPSYSVLASVGCLAATTVGFTSDWYFVGSRRPYAYLLLETLPRVLGTGAGIVLLLNGVTILAGPLSLLAGMLLAFAATSWWVLRRRPVTAIARRPVREIMCAQRNGVGSGVGASAYSALPLVLISLFAPGIQPSYALVDKLQRQLSVALGPVVAVVQGYVPRRDPSVTMRRARQALVAGAGFCLALAAVVLVVAPWLFGWLGAGKVQPDYSVMIVMSVLVGLNVWESVLARAVLASFDRLDAVARGTAISVAVGLPLVVAGALTFGLIGAFVGVLIGLTARTAYELVSAIMHMRRVQSVSKEEE